VPVAPATFRQVLGRWPSGVTVVTTADGGERHGLTASSFSSVSLEPPLVSVCVAASSRAHDPIAAAGVFAVNILRKDQIELGLRFAGMTDHADRFAGLPVRTAVTGAPLLDDALGWVDCKVWAAHAAGDHTIFIGEVLDGGVSDGAGPLVYASRSWGQFADALPDRIRVRAPGEGAGATVLDGSFGTTGALTAPEDVLARVSAAFAEGAGEVVLDDTAGASDPVHTREVLAAVTATPLPGPVGFRPRDVEGMGLALFLVALKSGVGVLEAEGDLRRRLDHMLDRMGIAREEA
jgi:flavin reductase (DIM6/NTAB) family NADH-FMN oxidoreductase RutF